MADEDIFIRIDILPSANAYSASSWNWPHAIFDWLVSLP